MRQTNILSATRASRTTAVAPAVLAVVGAVWVGKVVAKFVESGQRIDVLFGVAFSLKVLVFMLQRL